MNSDSLLVAVARKPDLFNTEVEEPESPIEQWVLAYVINPATHAFYEVWVGRVTGYPRSRPPYRLILDNLTPLPLEDALPPRFPSEQEHLFEDEERGDEEAG